TAQSDKAPRPAPSVRWPNLHRAVVASAPTHKHLSPTQSPRSQVISSAMISSLLSWSRHQIDLDTAVLYATTIGPVIRNRLARTIAAGANACRIDLPSGEEGGKRLRSPQRQLLIVLETASAIGVAAYLHCRFAILPEHSSQHIERFGEAGL